MSGYTNSVVIKLESSNSVSNDKIHEIFVSALKKIFTNINPIVEISKMITSSVAHDIYFFINTVYGNDDLCSFQVWYEEDQDGRYIEVFDSSSFASEVFLEKRLYDTIINELKEYHIKCKIAWIVDPEYNLASDIFLNKESLIKYNVFNIG